MELSQVDRILERHEFRHAAIIGILQDVQHIETYLPEDVLRHIARRLELSLARIFDIVTFYKAFNLQPRGRHIIKVCCGTACHLGGSDRALDEIRRKLALEESGTTADGNFSLERVNCLGACALAPVVKIDQDYHDAVDAGKVGAMLDGYEEERGGPCETP